MRILTFCTIISICMYLSACSDKAARYVNDSSDYTSFGIDLHDIDSVIANNTKSLLQSSYVKEMKSKKLLAISNIINQTHEDIDMEFVSRKFVRSIRQSNKFTLTNAIAGSGATTEQMIAQSRDLSNNPMYNQRTTQENGTLEAPELALSGRIIERKKTIDKIQRVDYMFLFVLTDLKSGKVLWDNEEIISKVTSNTSVQNENKSITCQNAKDCLKKDEYKGDLRTKGDLQTEEKHNTSKLPKKQTKNMILIGFDIGFGSLQGQMNEVIPTSLSGYGYIIGVKDDGTSTINIPINIRVGYLRKIANSYVGANIAYTKHFSERLGTTTERDPYSSSYNYTDDIGVKSERLGIEFMGVVGKPSHPETGLFLGVGLSKDINSSLTFPMIPMESGGDIVKDINGLYMPIRGGYLGSFKKTGLMYSIEMTTNIPLFSDSDYIKSTSLNVGIYYPILW
ncbi:hypothetical protein [Helicobacter japonicus]|uniref:Lipoprotein n=3 Tax=Helicobacter japonicus TaxID=425400 RepID=A0A4U8TQQ9_9HELI|nr:hypothetical protein [Helicobacter japonicus]TLE02794.1 hypothetical protein LS65_002395 [Helicobacter japonicus]